MRIIIMILGRPQLRCRTVGGLDAFVMVRCGAMGSGIILNACDI
jgi:hypothetical protein